MSLVLVIFKKISRIFQNTLSELDLLCAWMNLNFDSSFGFPEVVDAIQYTSGDELRSSFFGHNLRTSSDCDDPTPPTMGPYPF